MRLYVWTAVLVVACSSAFAVPPAATKSYAEGQRLFAEKDYKGALEQFQKTQELTPNEPLLDSWIGACLNAMGNYPEAETHLKTAIAALQKKKRPPDIGYYSLLAQIQVNLKQFEPAIATLQSFTFKEDGTQKAIDARDALEKAKVGLRTSLVSAGAECVRLKDRECARGAFAQAEALSPQEPRSLEAFARESLRQAAKAPSGSDEEKAARLTLYETALEATNLWLEGATEAQAPEIKRQLATALLGTKRDEDYQAAAKILEALWASSPEPKDSSIQLDLSNAYLGLKQWQAAETAARSCIAHSPEGKQGPGYCRLSLALRNQDKCTEALAAGDKCASSDGKAVELAFLKSCETMLAADAARSEREAERRKEQLNAECRNAGNLADWARDNASNIEIPEYVDAVKDVASKQPKCAATEFKVLDPSVVCLAGVGLMSNPANLSVLAAERKLDAYVPAYENYLKVCGRHLDGGQRASVEAALARVKHALGTP
jgi:thioredoxin-like negative regulator of GroEL